MKSMTSQERTHMMLHQPVSRVISRLAVPTIISMLITNIYNMADTFFVSQLGTSASGAVGVVFSAMAMIQALAFTIGQGGGINVSHALGSGHDEDARRFCSTAIVTAFTLGAVLAVLALCNLDGLVRFLGATETIVPYAMDYATYIFYAAPFMMASLAMNNLLRFQGLAVYGMVGVTTGGVLNMILDPILIFGFNLGASGAAIATALSQAVSFFILLIMCNTRPDAISIRLRDFAFSGRIYGRIFYNGVPSLGRQGIAAIATVVLNTAAGIYGDAAIAALSIVNRFVMFINSAVIGFGQGFQPVCGFNFGAGQYSRVREAFRFAVKVTTILLVCLVGVTMLLAQPIITVFRPDDPDVIRIGTLALRLQLLTMPLWGFITISNMFTQSIGYGVRATIISAARQGFCLIPMLLILPSFLDLLGLQMAQPIADIITFILALAIVGGILSRMKAQPDQEVA